MSAQAQQLIDTLGLAPHPEGGWYRETWRGPAGHGQRAVGTAILFLLESHQRSHWHRVDAHELWLWQKGDPLALSIAADDHAEPEEVVLGDDPGAGHRFQGVVPAHHWQSAHSLSAHQSAGYSLVSCVVAPGFDFAGFELAAADWQPGGIRTG